MIPAYRKLRRVLRWLLKRDVFLGPDKPFNYRVLGNSGAAWAILPDLIDPSLPVYSFGVGEDISFDLALIEGFGVAIEAFDPTPRSVKWVSSQHLPSSLTFNQLGIAAKDGTIAFEPPRNLNHVSYREADQHDAKEDSPTVICAVNRLETILNSKGHSKLTLLKLDIEGMEYSVIEDMLNSRIHPTQLLVEFHHRWYSDGATRTKKSCLRLKEAGYLISHVSANGEEISFVHSSAI